MQLPKTKKVDIVDEIHDISVDDSYRWLENGDDEDVKKWIAEQNQYADSFLRNEDQKKFSDELAKNYKVNMFSNPVSIRGRYFYVERQPDEDQNILYMKKGLDSAPIKLFDPNGKREGNTLTIDYWNPSQTGKYIAYGVSEGGDEMATLYIKDTDNNQELPDKIVRCRNASIKWLSDDSAFFYTRNPRPGTVPINEEHLHCKVYFHRIGENPDTDELIFGADRPKDDMIVLGLSLDDRYLSIKVSQEWTRNEIYIFDRQSNETKPLVTGTHSQFDLSLLRGKVLLETNYKANNFRVLWTTYENLFKPLEEWEELIPEREFLIESVAITASKVIVQYLVKACSKVVVFDHEGKEMGEIPLPAYSTLVSISSLRDEEEFFYGVASFIFPRIVYRYDPSNAQYVEYRETDNPINPDEYEVRQEWYESKDSTRIPMFILHKKGIALNGTNPTILYGYGGFGNCEKPGFNWNWVPWIERGGIFAIANIRGGGEFGETWHKGGIKENKQNCFDDFIAAGEYLIGRHYTDREHLGIIGGSNGGLLVSVVAVQRPDLFKAACARVPLTDMVRFPKFGMAIRWIHEYGNPEVKEDLQRILTWSPYHNVKECVEYPNMMFITADKDTRVDSMHSRKMAALLQSVNKENSILLFTEMDAGHGSGKPVSKVVESQSLVLTFFAKELGLKMP